MTSSCGNDVFDWFSSDPFSGSAPRRCVLWSDPTCGLRAVLVIDDVTLGPAAGGVRTAKYLNVQAAMADASRLARAMTVKCALGGLDAGGAKVVVLDHLKLDRLRAFAQLGRFVEELGGLFRTAGDLGTSRADLQAMDAHCSYVHTDDTGLADAVARGLLRCLEACAAERGVEVGGLRIAVQGCGAIGGAVARMLAPLGVELVLADVDTQRVRSLAEEVGARVAAPTKILAEDVDVLCPCATGGVVTERLAEETRAWAVCGAANNLLTSPVVAEVLAARGILHVPDVLASAGAVIDGIGLSVMGLADRTPLIDKLGDTARDLFDEARRTGHTTEAIAVARARRRIARGRS